LRGGLVEERLAEGREPVDGLREGGGIDPGLLEDGLVEQLDVETLVPRELVVRAVDELLRPEVREVDVLDRLRDQRVEAEQQALACVLADPALADREVD